MQRGENSTLLLKFNSLAHLHLLSKEKYKVEGDKKRNTSKVLTTISVFMLCGAICKNGSGYSVF